MKLIPIIALIILGLLGISMMTVAFIIIRRRGGWAPAMRPDAEGHWPHHGNSCVAVQHWVASVPSWHSFPV